MTRPYGYLLPEPGIDPMAVVREVARGFAVSHHDLLSSSRIPNICVARACAMAVVREVTGLSYPAIGEVFDRDHTTVMYNVKKVMDDAELRRGVELVVEELSPPPRLFVVEPLRAPEAS